MTLTRETVANKLSAYLHHEIGLGALVDWAEAAMMDADFDEAEAETLRDALARLGLADVRAFGLTWEDCEAILRRLGYTARLRIEAI